MSEPEAEQTPVEKPAEKPVRSIWVMATANLPDLFRGQITEADPRSQWIQDHLRTGLLVRVDPPPPGA